MNFNESENDDCSKFVFFDKILIDDEINYLWVYVWLYFYGGSIKFVGFDLCVN